MHTSIFSKENYLVKAGHYPEVNQHEKAILSKLKLIDRNDTRMEGLYYLVLWDLFLIGDKEDAVYLERLRLARLLRYLYANESGIVLMGKKDPSAVNEITTRQIREFQEVIKKQLSETFLMVRLHQDSEFHFVKKAWSCENAMQWPPELRTVEVLETTTFAMKYMKQDKPVRIVIGKDTVDMIISMEEERIIDEKRTYLGRFLSFINKYATKYGYFDHQENTISIPDALFLYDTLELLEFVQPNQLSDEHEKYLFIKKELKNGK